MVHCPQNAGHCSLDLNSQAPAQVLPLLTAASGGLPPQVCHLGFVLLAQFHVDAHLDVPKIQFIPPHTSSPCSLPCRVPLGPKSSVAQANPPSPLPLLPGLRVWTVFPRLPEHLSMQRDRAREITAGVIYGSS